MAKHKFPWTKKIEQIEKPYSYQPLQWKRNRFGALHWKRITLPLWRILKSLMERAFFNFKFASIHLFLSTCWKVIFHVFDSWEIRKSMQQWKIWKDDERVWDREKWLLFSLDFVLFECAIFFLVYYPPEGFICRMSCHVHAVICFSWKIILYLLVH